MLQGDIHILPLPDLIQWLAMTRRTGKLGLVQENRKLEIYFAKGEIAAATTGGLMVADTPEKVHVLLRTALTGRAGRFAFSEESLPVWVTTINLRLSAEALLHDVLVRLNKGQQASPSLRLNQLTETGINTGLLSPTETLRLQVVDHLMEENFSVPAMPQLATRVLELTYQKNFSLRELSNIVLADQAIAARILRFANSVLHGGEREIDSLAWAVQRLGADEVVNIVLAASLQARRLGRDSFAEEKHRLWIHSSTAALIARTLAVQVQLDRHVSFLCGLLMDFGMNVLYSVIQGVLTNRTRGAPIPPQAIEEIVRDFHPRIGRVVGEKWRLPATVIEAMAYHHCFDEAPSENPYVAVVALADYLTTLALGQSRAALETSLALSTPEQLAAHPAARHLGLSAYDAATVLVDLPQHVDQALLFVMD